MIPAFHVCSFTQGDRIELSIEEKISLYCSATQWAKHNGPIDLICDEHFLNYILREGLDELYMNIVPLPEGDDVVELALKTAPIGHVYLGLDVVVNPETTDFRYKDLFQSTGPEDLSLENLPQYPKQDKLGILEDAPDWVSEYFV